MNCWKGCLAVVVKHAQAPQTIGTLVEVLEYRPGPDGGPAWIINPPLWEGDLLIGLNCYKPDWVLDACLCPLQPPPNTISDSEVEDLYQTTPNPEQVE